MSAKRLLGLAMVSSWLAAGCSSAKKIEVGGTCVLNSDCNSPLLCSDSKCHDACHASIDCPAGENCVKTASSTVCQLPAEASCARTPCSSAYVCASDLQCRAPCQSAADCADAQVCVTNVCADTNELENGQLPQKGPSPAADGGTDAQATATGGTGGGGGLGGASGSSGAVADAAAGGSGGTDVALGSGGTDGGIDGAPPDVPATRDMPGMVDGGCSASCTGNTPVCLNGNCVACSPGDTTGCVANAPATCSTTGAWVANALACVNQTCLNGVCQGRCAPTQTVCVSSAQAATCSSTGTLQNLTDCGSGQCINGTCVASPPSCPTGDGGISGCGASNESCCTSLEVPGGTYYRTYTYGADGGTGMADPATVSGFRLDKYLVTVGRFRQFVSAWKAGWLPSGGSGIHTHLNGGKGLASAGNPGTYETGWNPMLWNSYVTPTDTNLVCTGSTTWTTAAGGKENLPITCVNWYEAYAFCIWDGGFLPSEAEWEYVAAGGSDQREYPWGAQDPGRDSQYAVYNGVFGGIEIASVGAAMAGAGRWGQLDLAGEAWEWTLDAYSVYVDPCTDCSLTVLLNNVRVVRGGSWETTVDMILPTYRTQNTPDSRFSVGGWGACGFRCARIP